MPKRTDLKKIVIVGSGPIVIGQACEFDYSGTQGCKALREEGYEVVLVNSNPATIMTDPDMGDRTYVEPTTPETVAEILRRERPQALLPTLGGQTGLNVARALAEDGVLDELNVELIGAKLPAIWKAEDRQLFKEAMRRLGLEVPRSGIVHDLDQAKAVIEHVRFPAIIRASFTMGGTGAGTAYNAEEYRYLVERGLASSPVNEVLVEQSLIGWKEFELEVMRDLADNVVIICSIENFDPMGVHTGDSITVAPTQTLSDKEYQKMRDAAVAIIREIGVETGGSNIQFCLNPENGEMMVIEMNPRVSRSSALASKATGFPIAKIAAKLAVGYTLDEITNDITGETPASFEPTIDYTVVKIPRFNFEKFPGSVDVLGTQMQSVGETMAIGRTFEEALQKALRSLETSRDNLCLPAAKESGEEILARLATPHSSRLLTIADAYRMGLSTDIIHERTKIDRWFLEPIREIVEMAGRLSPADVEAEDFPEKLQELKQWGFPDKVLAKLWHLRETDLRKLRKEAGVVPVYKTVDTCAAEFEAYTPYHYSSYETPFKRLTDEGEEIVRATEIHPSDRKKVMILGGGPNRIGQGIEFDYCCCQAVFALKEDDFETIMVNSNPETVSTDYDIADRLYFEPITFEDVMNIIEAEKPLGVILQFGGQTPLKLALQLEAAGVKILGTSPESIDITEDRKRFGKLLDDLKIPFPPGGTATSFEEAREIANRIGYPLLVRPSYVLGGRGMVICHRESALKQYLETAVEASPDHPVLLDRFLEDAIEVDVDAVCDGEDVYIGGIMEHIEYAGVHSGDSACVIPPRTLTPESIQTIEECTRKLALALDVKGLMNVQYAVYGTQAIGSRVRGPADFPDDVFGKHGNVFVLEVNPRASRTVPYVSKAIGIPLARIASRVMLGKSLREQGLGTGMAEVKHISVKEASLPFNKFPGVDPLLGPEMRSTGEVMGISDDFGLAFAKAQESISLPLPTPPAKGETAKILCSVSDLDKPDLMPIARALQEMGFVIVATGGTLQTLIKEGIPAEYISKIGEGRPSTRDIIVNRDVAMVINTPWQERSQRDDLQLRRATIENSIPYFTTIAAARAAVEGIRARLTTNRSVKTLQEYHTTVDPISE